MFRYIARHAVSQIILHLLLIPHFVVKFPLFTIGIHKCGLFLSTTRLHESKFVLLSVLTHKEKICLRIRAKSLPDNAKSLLPVGVRR